MLELETLTGVLRCFLPRRYWSAMGRGAYLSCLLTIALGVRVGFEGFFAYASRLGGEGAALALKVGGGGGVPGMDPTSQAAAALMGNAMAPLSFFLFTPTGWLADYLFFSGLIRAITLAAGNPWGDPVLTVIDHWIHGRIKEDEAQAAAAALEAAAGPEVPDTIVAGTQFAGKRTDFVIVSSRRKEGWTAATTVMAGGVRLRLGEPVDRRVKGLLRTCYPLKVVNDLQVDRRIVYYDWPADAPPLPQPEPEPESWTRTEEVAASDERVMTDPPGEAAATGSSDGEQRNRMS